MDGSAPPAANAAAISSAGDSLYRRYDRWLRAVLRKRHGVELGDDVATETFMRVAPFAAAEHIRNPKAFLLRVAQNLVVDRRRRGQIAVTPDSDLEFERASAPPSQEEALTLKQIVLALPPELRDVFILNHIEGRTYQEIAETLGIPFTTVHHRMRLALARTAAAMRD